MLDMTYTLHDLIVITVITMALAGGVALLIRNKTK